MNATLAQTLVRRIRWWPNALRTPPRAAERLIGDTAYEFDKLDAELNQSGGKLIAPNRSNRKRKTQEGRPLRRYPAQVEGGTAIRVAAELSQDRGPLRAHPGNSLGMLHLVYCLILMRGS